MKNSAKSKKIFFFLAIMILGSIGLDQWTKYVAEKNLMVWESPKNSSYYEGKRVPISTWGKKEGTHIAFALNYVRNKGAAWGAFSNLSENIRKPFFHMVAIIATILILLFWRSIPSHHYLARFCVALVFSGALGNFIDRFRRGFVVDFLDVSWSIPLPFKETNWIYDFPKFNWADSCITLGVLLILVEIFINKESVLLRK